jgi:hypothetical protein
MRKLRMTMAELSEVLSSGRRLSLRALPEKESFWGQKTHARTKEGVGRIALARAYLRGGGMSRLMSAFGT